MFFFFLRCIQALRADKLYTRGTCIQFAGSGLSKVSPEMIPLFFYKKFIINSPLSQEEAFQKLSEETAARRGFRFGFESGPESFEGSVSKDRFQIYRSIRYRNSFLPMIYGRFSPSETGSQIRVFMTLHPIVLFTVASSGLLAGLSVLYVVYQLITTGPLDDLQKKTLQVIGVIYMICTLSFGIEAITATRMLKRIFEAK